MRGPNRTWRATTSATGAPNPMMTGPNQFAPASTEGLRATTRDPSATTTTIRGGNH